MAQPIVSLIEAKIRLFWSRLGAAVERSIGPRSSQPFDIASVLDSAERDLEEKVHREGDRMVAPNRVDVRFDYETYSRLTDLQREVLVRTLQSGLTEFVHNRRYSTADDIRVRLEFDAFVRRVTVQTRFEDVLVVVPGSLPATMPGGLTIHLMLRPVSSNYKRELQAVIHGGRPLAGLGRSRDNEMVLDDGSVSNFHASFAIRGTRTVWISDLGSSNGTMIDGVPLGANESREIRGGERLRFGDIDFELALVQKD
ncbi:MAG: FHA domain-containing protein [Acidobacteriota bacterium]